MCNCIKDLEKGLEGKIIDRKKVENARLVIPYIMLGAEPWQTNSQMELTFEGKKKRVTMAVAHKFCPLCGTKYPEPRQWKTIPE